MRKPKWLVVLACCFMLWLGTGANGLCQEDGQTDAKEEVIAALLHMSQLNSYHMQMDAKGSVKLKKQSLNFALIGESDINAKPMQMKTVMNISVKGNQFQQQQNMQQYILQEGEKLNIYSQLNKQWTRQVVVMPPVPEGTAEDYRQEFSQVSKVKDTEEAAVYQVTLDGKYLKDAFAKGLLSAGLSNLNGMENLLDGVGDLSYSLTLDKKSKEISSINLDLSQLLSHMGEVLANSAESTPQQQLASQEVLHSLQLVIALRFSRFNEADPIELPTEALHAPMVQNAVQGGIGCVDVGKIEQQGLASKEYNQPLEDLSERLNVSLEEDRNNLSEAEFYEKQQQEYQNFLAAKNMLKKEFDAKLQRAVAKVATKRQLSSVLYKQTENELIPFSCVDITAEVMAELEKI